MRCRRRRKPGATEAVRALVLGLLVALAAPAARGQDAARPGASFEARAAAILFDDGLAERAGALRALGADALPALVRALGTGEVRGEDERVFTLAEAQEELVLDALLAFGDATLRPYVEAARDPAAGMEARALALALLSRLGGADDLRLCRDLAPGAEPRPSALLERAVAGILRRSPAGYDELPPLLLDAQDEAFVAVVDGVARAGSPRGLESLAALLGFQPERDRRLLVALGTLAERLPGPCDERVAGAAREYLWAADPWMLRDAAMALGRLGDSGAVERLIELVEDEERPVREGAHWALCRITGLDFPLSSARWRAWYREEAAWFAERAAEAYVDLGLSSEARVAGVLNELSRRRLHRFGVAAEVERVLQHDSPVVRRLACLALRQLGVVADPSALVACLDDEEPSVALAALAALRAITARDLPASSAAWREHWGLFG